MEIAELPNPIPKRGEVLVRTHFSAISTGTEGKTVSDARKGYIAKAKSRQAEVVKVVNAAKTYGISDTYKMVMNRLEALQPLGYSSSGVVVGLGAGVDGFKLGDRVACGGAAASHAELVCIPENLCVQIPDAVPLEEAAFTTIGAIAMQGLRRADLKIGENCAVIGLGLIGQITVKLLKAAGIKAFGIDVKPELINLALQSGAASAALRSDESLLAQVQAFSKGHGVDAVIITAATSSTDPVELAGALCRHHGKVVIVGSVPTGFTRKNYYRKELDLLMSTSYGPGRYDANYEEKGMDYPIGQVRWTENRNMQAFAELLGATHFSLSDLISHRFDFANAEKAFDLVVATDRSKMGIVLEYDTEKPIALQELAEPYKSPVSHRLSVIGAGSFASNFLLPNLPDTLRLGGIATSRPHTAENAKRKYGFAQAYSNVDQMLGTDGSGAVVIATRHDSHAPLALAALKARKRVFLEKPLCLTIEQYFEFKALFDTGTTPDLMVGFNRRFSPAIVHLQTLLSGIPVAINYRINAGSLPADHWVHDPDVGGGRIIGEVCHFIDLCTFIARSEVKSISATSVSAPSQNQDTLVAALEFENGSVASISYFSNGSKELAKEYLEVFSGGVSAVIDDFKSMRIMGETTKVEKLKKQDKGHSAEIRLFAEAITSGSAFPISVKDVMHSTLATFALLESIKLAGQRVNLKQYIGSWISPKAN